MTVGRLLQECSSVELTLWQHYLRAAAGHQESHTERRRLEQEIGV